MKPPCVRRCAALGRFKLLTPDSGLEFHDCHAVPLPRGLFALLAQLYQQLLDSFIVIGGRCPQLEELRLHILIFSTH